MAKVNRYKDDRESTTSVWNDSGDKRYGFVSKDKIANDPINPDTRWTTRYGVGIDNTRSPYSGYSEKNVNTPFGTIDYGYDGDTSFAGFTPNFERTRDYYTNGSGEPWSMDYASVYNNMGDDSIFRAGKYGNPSAPTYFASQFLPGDRQYIPDFDKSFNTPFGNLQLESNYDSPNVIDANFTPNAQTNYYLQALANLLKR